MTIEEQEPFSIGYVTSKDGTRIGYRQRGHGPGLIILHGSLSTGYYHIQLAKALSDRFTVTLPDRRGFGLSDPFHQEDGILKDVEDLEALLAQVAAHNLFGVSVGAIIALKAALSVSAIHKLAIYEPPLFTNAEAPQAMMARFDDEMAQGNTAAALTTAMKGAPLISDLFSALPRGLIEFMTRKTMSFKAAGDYASFEELAPTLYHDGQVILAMSGQPERLKGIRAGVLLLGGSSSTVFLKSGLEFVAKALPHARRITLPGLNHGSTWNVELRGKPELIVPELKQFFEEGSGGVPAKPF